MIEGVVLPLKDTLAVESFDGLSRRLKVPQVGWNQVWQTRVDDYNSKSWEETPLAGVAAGEYMYFVHSYYVRPAETSIILSTTQYGQIEFCSCLSQNHTFACQFHPERSGQQGLQIYKNIAEIVAKGD